MTFPGSPTVVLENATLGYRADAPVLVEVDVSIHAGELVGVVGCSGAGKSTLLSALCGAPVQLSGRVLVESRDPRRSGHRVGLVPQLGDEVLTNLSLIEVISLGRPRAGLFTSRAERAAVSELLDRLGLGGFGSRRMGELSGGQRQRVAIARALTASSAVLLCDEPTSGADPALTAEIVGVLAEVAAAGATVIIATHDLSVVAPQLDRLIGIAGNGIRFDGNPVEFGAAEQSAVYGTAVQARGAR